MMLASPLWLLALLPLLALALWVRQRRRQRTVVFRYSRGAAWAARQGAWQKVKAHAPPVLGGLGLLLLVLALTRPQAQSEERELDKEAVDLLLCLDISGSMLAQDLQPDRLQAAKAVARDFVIQRAGDRLGLVIFGGEAITQCPLTLDHRILDGLIERVETGLVEDGTAIGLAIATGLNRLKESPADSRAMILLTDGENNRGIDPLTARDLAKSMGVRIYTIGVGTEGMAPYPVRNMFGRIQMQQVEVKIDEPLLREIAESTGGQYFRARDVEELKQIYGEIDRLERAEIQVREFNLVEERFRWLLAPALCSLLLGQLLGLWWRRWPA